MLDAYFDGIIRVKLQTKMLDDVVSSVACLNYHRIRVLCVCFFWVCEFFRFYSLVIITKFVLFSSCLE